MPKKKIDNKKYHFLIAGSFLALAGFFVIYSSIGNSLLSRQRVLSGASEQIYAPRNFVKTNSDPLITKAGDYYQSFVRNYTPVIGTGNPQIIFFGDFTDTASRATWNELMVIKEKFDFTLAWKNFPAAVSDASRRAGLAILCASQQNKFLDYADLLFSNQDDLDSANLRALAKKAGLNLDLFGACLTDERMILLLGQDLEDGQNLMIDQAPYLFVGNSRVESGQISELEKIIESER
jgi:protein-disulfide isomerase